MAAAREAGGSACAPAASTRHGALLYRRWHDGLVTLSADFSAVAEGDHAAEVERLCDAMEAADRTGRYPRLTVERPWSVHNPVLEGEFASPGQSAGIWSVNCAGWPDVSVDHLALPG